MTDHVTYTMALFSHLVFERKITLFINRNHLNQIIKKIQKLLMQIK